MTPKQSLLPVLILIVLCPLSIFGQSVEQYFRSNFTIRGFQDGTIQPYPSEIRVEGMPQYLHNITIDFELIHTTGVDELDILLEAPNGQYLILMSDVAVNEATSLGSIFFGTEAMDTYEVIRLNVPQDGEYLIGATNFDYSNSPPPLFIYEDDFDADRPQEQLLASVILEDKPSPFFIRADTVLTLSKEKDYYLVSARRLFTEGDYLDNTYLYFWVDGPAEAVLSPPIFNGRSAAAHGRVISYHGLLENEFVCQNTSG